jgi:hypothetical protein
MDFMDAFHKLALRSQKREHNNSLETGPAHKGPGQFPAFPGLFRRIDNPAFF